ncbi:hypothetical protein HanXRQr2_Chr04g0160861 [Helianthus annuus]|uniref:Uncharacterized protein n=1 Tax=Helianthus annuus TaxID=4232 RepID=A0A9K3NRY9_HELAN|nr:hypothetical protein HanXRQr2_Chr04g0160861 [Helianthus annuus]KAJ0930897.1 hypothetical protein HanPSC8_Chr04g0154941 [Helianthus annuus]
MAYQQVFQQSQHRNILCESHQSNLLRARVPMRSREHKSKADGDFIFVTTE